MQEYALSVYKTLEWTVNDISIVLERDGTDDPVAMVVISYPDGCLEAMADVATENRRRRIVLTGLHLQGSGGPNSLGTGTLRRLVQLVMEYLNVDEIHVSGGIRTTGANPGRRNGQWRFTRRP